jgi:hypothetical protein
MGLALCRAPFLGSLLVTYYVFGACFNTQTPSRPCELIVELRKYPQSITEGPHVHTGHT